ncbi:N-lysine methyltransferase setd6 [Stigmatopora argus]
MTSEAKRPKVDDDTPLQNFLRWCDGVGLVLSPKVRVSKEGTVADYGMLAQDDIKVGEVLFTIPRSALLHQGTTSLSALLEREKVSLESSSGWVPLLLALLYEYTAPQSKWKSYLSLWTDFKMLDHPMFWSKEERDRLLTGTGIPEAVDKDLANIQSEYRDIVLPFMAKHPDIWNPLTHTLELYTQLVAFVMAYSFQEPPEVEEDEEEDEKPPNPPMMVPMADMLNHVSKHNANLEFTPDTLKMVCVCPIKKGEEVFNTYGQMANWQLLHMYGFTQPYHDNADDTVDIPVANLHKAAAKDGNQQLLKEMWEVLQEKGAFVFGKNGCLTDIELHGTLKMLCMSREEFVEFKDNDGWEDDEDEEEINQAFSNGGLPGLTTKWKQLIHKAARLTVAGYRGIDRDKALMKDKALLGGLSSRQRNALHVRYGQKTILDKVIELTKT